MAEADIIVSVAPELDQAALARMNAQIQNAARSSMASTMGQSFVTGVSNFVNTLPKSITSKFEMGKVNKALETARESSAVVSNESIASQKLLVQFMREVSKSPGTIERGVQATSLIEQGNAAINQSRAHLRKAANIQSKMDTARGIAEGNLAASTVSIGEIDRYLAANDVDNATKRSLLQIKGSALSTKLKSQIDMGATPEEMVPTIMARNENTKQLKELNKTLKPIGGAITSIVGSMAMGGVRTATQLFPSMWGENVTRNLVASERAFAERQKIGSNAVGSIAGSLVGGVIGGVVAGPAGALIGASIGSSTGGAIGGLYGEAKSTQLESHLKSIQQTAQVYRARSLYGGKFSPTYAAAVEETGLASAGDMEHMASSAETLPFRMMFGQVGENEMLMYSLMPNYWAAMMNGASQAELMEAYRGDLDSLPPMMRTAVGSMVGGGSMGAVAYAMNPYFDVTQRMAGFDSAVDEYMYRYGGRVYQSESARRGGINAGMKYESFRKDIFTGESNPGIFNQLPRAERVWLSSVDHTNELSIARMEENERYAVNSMKLAQKMALKALKSDEGGVVDAQLGLSANTLVRALSTQAIDQTPIIINVFTPDGELQQTVQTKGREAKAAGQTLIVG